MNRDFCILYNKYLLQIIEKFNISGCDSAKEILSKLLENDYNLTDNQYLDILDCEYRGIKNMINFYMFIDTDKALLNYNRYNNHLRKDKLIKLKI